MSLVVEQLHRRYAQIPALRGVSFEVPAGQIVGLIGPNGAGKTTLLRILATYCPPSSGRAVVNGFDVASHSEQVRQSLGYLPESLPSDPALRVGEYLDHRARLKRLDRRRRIAEIDRCLGLCDLRTVRQRLVCRLSQGYRRRVGLADALLGGPPVLLLDEPTIGLDPVQVSQTRATLSALAGQTTILLSTHLLAEAELLCQRVLALLHGELALDLPLSELQAHSGIELELATTCESVGTVLSSFPGVVSVELLASTDGSSRWRLGLEPETPRESIAAACHSQGFGLRELRVPHGTLEEHLLRAVVRPWSECA